MKDRKLTAAEIAAARARSRAAIDAHMDGERGAWDRWLDREGYRPARLEFPLGELQNPEIRGYVWAWGMQGKVATGGITSADGFNAQGLEGKALVDVDLITALLVCELLPAHRCNVFVPRQEASRAS